MNITAAAGGSSCKQEENGGPYHDSRRPLKKARFPWQVKGKHHLKNGYKDTAKASTVTTNPDIGGPSDNVTRSGQNLGTIGDYYLKQDLNSLDSRSTPSGESGHKPKSGTSNGRWSYPPYLSYEQKVLTKREKNINNVPASMVVTQNAVEQCIAKWQAKQTVKSFLDNSINHVLDAWIREPLPPENETSRFIALDVADFINNLPEDNSVENEGILMAISAHGLQQPGSSSSRNNINTNVNISCNDDNVRQLTPQRSDNECHEIDNIINSNTTRINLEPVRSISDEQSIQSDNRTAFSLLPDTSLSCQEFSSSPQNSSSECDKVQNLGANDCDFLDTAILFAIQSKGLTTSGPDYG